MKVLSLFDGLSGAQLALQKLGIPVDKYVASEVDPYAIKVTQSNFPETIQAGDVQKYKVKEHFDLITFGSPCQGFSFAGKNLNFDDPRSKLFFEAVRILEEAKAINPNIKFLMENVRMKKESEHVISKYLGVEPIAINSNIFSAQNRYRLYWTNLNVGELPQDKGIVLKDILEDDFITDRDKSHCIDANYFKGGNLKSYFEKHRRQLVFSKDGLCHVGDADLKGHNAIKRVYHIDGKSPTLTTMRGGHREPKIMQRARGWNKGGLKALNGKTPSITTSAWQDNNHLTKDDGATWRKLTPLECERLQTVPDNYTNHVSNTQRYKMLGNGFNVDTIAFLLADLK
tara:strand:+ start:419 stop:1444 length:1026 start_codon:yes stop_codon:yes gene_type:complete